MQYDLVFEGGGAKGISFVGAMQAFEESGHTLGRLLGTSAGAITATLLAAGYTAPEMRTVLNETVDGQPVFATFLAEPSGITEESVRHSTFARYLKKMDIPFIPSFLENRLDGLLLQFMAKQSTARHLFSFVEYGGWYSADAFVQWLTDKLNSGTYQGKPRHFGSLNLAEFHQATGMDISLVASNTTAQRMLVLNHQTAPDCPVVWATRMSMSIPFLWQEVTWQEKWGHYLKQDISGHTVVDGAVLSNFPIELFVSTDQTVTHIMGEQQSDRVLGLLLDESQRVEGIDPNANEPKSSRFAFDDLPPTRRFHQLLKTMLEARDKRAINAYRDKIVHLPVKGYGLTEFDMSDTRQKALIAAGYQTMQTYLAEQSPQPATFKGMPSFGLPTHAAESVSPDMADRMAAEILTW